MLLNNDAGQLKINLQLFAEEKTEKATPRRREEARKKGQVLRSMEINSAFILLACFLTLKFIAPYWLGEMQKMLQGYLANLPREDLTLATITPLIQQTIWSLLKLSLPLMVVALGTGLAVNYLQVGFLVTAEPLKMDLTRINPVAGLRRMFSKRTLVELIKALIKILIIGYIIYINLKQESAMLPNVLNMSLRGGIVFFAEIIFQIAIQAGLALLMLAGFDYLFQWWEHEQQLKMSKQEIKDEYKNIEGNPLIKSKIRERQRIMAMRRMMHDVPKADVVITNPTHLAIAIKYDQRTMNAPTVLAKGKDRVAEKIKLLAIEHKITIVENKPLAQALYKSTEIGAQIPVELYQAVAEVLAFIYQFKKRA